MAPIVPPKYLSVTGAHDWPALIDLQTPPPVVPIQNSFSRDGLPVTATERPPRKGPTSRQRSPVKVSESRWANAADVQQKSRATDVFAEECTGTSRWDGTQGPELTAGASTKPKGEPKEKNGSHGFQL